MLSILKRQNTTPDILNNNNSIYKALINSLLFLLYNNIRFECYNILTY